MKTRGERMRELYRDPEFDRMAAKIFMWPVLWVWAGHFDSPWWGLAGGLLYLMVFVSVTEEVVTRVNERIDKGARKRKHAPPTRTDDDDTPAGEGRP